MMTQCQAQLLEFVPGRTNNKALVVLDQLSCRPFAADHLTIGGATMVVETVQANSQKNLWIRLRHGPLGKVTLGVTLTSSGPNSDILAPGLPATLSRPPFWHESETDLPRFEQLNAGWNADPNAPYPRPKLTGETLCVDLRPNFFQTPDIKETDMLRLRFGNCSKFRLTPVNDHGWSLGQCRFSGLAPQWGEFYELTGNTHDDRDPTPWCLGSGSGQRHFHFYLRDETLEVKAGGWSKEVINGLRSEA